MSGEDPSRRESLAVLAARVLGIGLDAAKKEGKSADVSVHVRRDESANLRFARNEATTAGQGGETSITLSVALGLRHASTSTNQSSEASLRALADRALTMAKLSPEDPERMPPLPPQTYVAVPSAFDEALAAMSPADRAALAKRAIDRGDAAKVQIAGFFERSAEEHVTRTSSGLFAEHRETSAQYTVTARTLDGTGSGWAGREAHRMADVDDAALAAAAIDKGVRSAAAKPMPPGKYTVVLEPQAVYEMLSYLVPQMDQRSADEGRSFFAGKGGQKLFADGVTLTSDPSDPAAPGAPYDSEGLALRPHVWIDRGRVKDLHVSRFWAVKTGKKPTGDASVFHLRGGAAASVDELVKGVKRGLLVTRFWYNRMLEPQTVRITGLTRDGVFAIENGRIVGPVANFRYNESPITVLRNVDAMTKSTWRAVSYGQVWRVPALRTHEFTMASPSAAV